MVKMIFKSGALYFLVAILFAISAIDKTISNDSIVIVIQWFCAIVFTVAGFWKIIKSNTRATSG